MKRMENAIKDYKKKYKKNEGKIGYFTTGDIYEIVDITKNQSGNVDFIDLITNALMGGYQIGYRRAKRECRDRS